ncbi:MAG: hypothetical protein HQM12_10405 [SAR324 cluster bacterium]|nr:hypothetical protein [SAR324 cluster bacterium]
MTKEEKSEEEKSVLGAKMKAGLAVKGWSQSDFVKKFNEKYKAKPINEADVSRWCNGVHKSYRIADIAAFFGIPHKYLSDIKYSVEVCIAFIEGEEKGNECLKNEQEANYNRVKAVFERMTPFAVDQELNIIEESSYRQMHINYISLMLAINRYDPNFTYSFNVEYKQWKKAQHALVSFIRKRSERLYTVDAVDKEILGLPMNYSQDELWEACVELKTQPVLGDIYEIPEGNEEDNNKIMDEIRKLFKEADTANSKFRNFIESQYPGKFVKELFG